MKRTYPRHRGKFTKKATFAEKMTAPKLFVLVTLFTYGVSLSPSIHEKYFVPQVYAEEMVEQPIAGQTLPSPTPSPEPTPVIKSKSIDDLLTEYFPDPKLAKAVMMAEGGINPKAANKGKANGKYRGECSIGHFQINLASDGCTGKRVHWSKVPGETLEEKIAWLEVPENNFKIASDIYKASGWQPWGGYTSGNYRKFLK